jgi:uncharacterized membrane protein
VTIILALVIGVVAGLRALTAPAAASWIAYLGLGVGGTWLAFMGYWWVALLFTVLALVEFVTDQLPSTPSRTVPVQFGVRIVTGALSGATIGAGSGLWLVGAIAGIVGAVIGTLGGAVARARLAAGFGRDRPAALIEDAVAIVVAIVVVLAAR